MDERDLYKRFGHQLRTVRELRGVTQAELATRIGMARTSITNIEQGNQPIHLATLYRLAQALEADVTDLLPDSTAEAMRQALAGVPDAEVQQFVERVTQVVQ